MHFLVSTKHRQVLIYILLFLNTFQNTVLPYINEYHQDLFFPHFCHSLQSPPTYASHCQFSHSRDFVNYFCNIHFNVSSCLAEQERRNEKAKEKHNNCFRVNFTGHLMTKHCQILWHHNLVLNEVFGPPGEFSLCPSSLHF